MSVQKLEGMPTKCVPAYPNTKMTALALSS